MRVIISIILMVIAALVGFFFGAGMNEAMGGAILLSMITGFACTINALSLIHIYSQRWCDQRCIRVIVEGDNRNVLRNAQAELTDCLDDADGDKAVKAQNAVGRFR